MFRFIKSLFSQKPQVENFAGQHAICEAKGMSLYGPMHLRVLDESGLTYEGTVPTPALCGAEIEMDLYRVDQQKVRESLPRQSRQSFLCPTCTHRFTGITLEQQVEAAQRDFLAAHMY
jgi:hypothetical protein